MLTGAPALKIAKMRKRSGNGVKFNSASVPPHAGKLPRVAAALPWRYLKA